MCFPSCENTHTPIAVQYHQLACCCQTLTKCFKTPHILCWTRSHPHLLLPVWPTKVKGAMCFQLYLWPPTPLPCLNKKKKKWEKKTCLWHVSPFSCGPLARGCLQGMGRIGGCKERKQELDAHRNYPRLYWCEEAGSKLGSLLKCRSGPFLTGLGDLVLIDLGRTAVGRLPVKYMLTRMTYSSSSLPVSADKNRPWWDQARL